jgi:hypothetical protein
MDKKVLGIIIAAIVVALVIFAFMQWEKKGSQAINNVPQVNSVVNNPVENMPETNPFKSAVNPMEGYKNPFDE